MKQKYYQYFVEVTNLTSELSTCASKQVGSILVKNNRIVATSYNGVPSRLKHCNKIFGNEVLTSTFARDKHHEWSLLNEQHSEINLISYCSKEGISTKNGTLFTSLSPCISCAKSILASGIEEVFYIMEYDKDILGIKFLNINNIRCKKC